MGEMTDDQLDMDARVEASYLTVAEILERLIEQVRTMPPNGVISRWENVSRSAVIDLLLEAREGTGR